jgi:hypothetical protein
MGGGMIGHNSGRAAEQGHGWRTHCWSEARRALLPTLPLEVIRLRVARARELGLDYRTYATVRATSGEDIVAFLFSSNALRLLQPGDELPEVRAARLAALRACGRLVAAQPPLDPAALRAALEECIDHVAVAPPAFASWPVLRREVRAALAGRPGGGVLLVGDTALEREWVAAGRLAGFLAADRYFGP